MSFFYRELVENTIQDIKDREPKEGYMLGFSGGKDSVVIYHLAKMAEVKFTAHFAVTTVDPYDLIRFIKNNFPDVKFEKPLKTMRELIVQKQMLPSRFRRFCCAPLKEHLGIGRVMITGVRSEESPMRAKRGKWVEWKKKNISKKEKHSKSPSIQYNPILEWTQADVWRFIRQYNLPYCSLYDEGWNRIGCVGCPMASKKQREMEFKKYPKIEKMYKDAITEAFNVRKQQGKKTMFETPEDIWEYWMNS